MPYVQHLALKSVFVTLLRFTCLNGVEANNTPLPDSGVPLSACCAQCAGTSFCSPVSGNCYSAKLKEYYENCSGAGELSSEPSRARLARCCGNCEGIAFCSPVSGNCYRSKAQSYYENCSGAALPSPPSSVPAPTPVAACCGKCEGSAFCSPVSGNCYRAKTKGYYANCSGAEVPLPQEFSPSPAPAPSCCGKCDGSAFCSPVSGRCYGSRAKDYYEACSDGDSGSDDGSRAEDGLAPPPPPPSGGLVPPPPPASGGGHRCCDACISEQFCSPASGRCYASRMKNYYVDCEPMLVGDLVWADEFDRDGAVNESKWSYRNGPNPYNRELQYYTGRADNSFVEGGVLKIIAKCESYEGFDYTSARLVTRDLGDWGPNHRIEVRAKMPTGVGTWPAVWMLPTDTGVWPSGGEIDIMESVGCTAQRVYGTVHTDAFNHMRNTQVGTSYTCDAGEWHTYTIDWDESQIQWYIDGNHYHTFAPDTSRHAEWPFAARFYLILNVAVGGSWGGFCLRRPPSCSSSNEFATAQVMEVDFVRVHELVRASTTSAPILYP